LVVKIVVWCRLWYNITQSQACCRRLELHCQWNCYRTRFPRYRYEVFPDVPRKDSDFLLISLYKIHRIAVHKKRQFIPGDVSVKF